MKKDEVDGTKIQNQETIETLDKETCVRNWSSARLKPSTEKDPVLITQEEGERSNMR